MRDYEDILFDEILSQIKNQEHSVLTINAPEKKFIYLQYNLTRHFYYAAIIDDYPFEITGEMSLLEALYYQARLITMHTLNWDALGEALNDALNNFIEFEGVCLLFKTKGFKTELKEEFTALVEMIGQINKHTKQKRIYILLNGEGI